MSILVKDANGTNQTVETPAAAGRVGAAASKPTAWSNEDFATIGATTETMASGDTGTSGVNGRLQRIATNLTAYLSGKFTGLPTTLGVNGGLKVDGTKVVGGASALGDPGIPALAFRVDSLGAITTAEGQYTGLRLDAQGKLWIAAVQSGTWNIGSITTLPAVTVTGIPTTAAQRGGGPVTADTIRVVIVDEQVEGGEYEDIPASTPTAILGTTGAAGDFVSRVTIFPEDMVPGAVTLKDGTNPTITIFPGGVGSVSNLVPFTINFGDTSISGGWTIGTGSAVHVRVSGNFT